jgi:multiple sugar transport system ATP-binding protein
LEDQVVMGDGSSAISRDVVVGIRPADVGAAESLLTPDPAKVVRLQGRIELIERLGPEVFVTARVEGAAAVVGRFHSRADLREDELIELAFDSRRIHLFDKATGAALMLRSRATMQPKSNPTRR